MYVLLDVQVVVVVALPVTVAVSPWCRSGVVERVRRLAQGDRDRSHDRVGRAAVVRDGAGVGCGIDVGVGAGVGPGVAAGLLLRTAAGAEQERRARKDDEQRKDVEAFAHGVNPGGAMRLARRPRSAFREKFRAWCGVIVAGGGGEGSWDGRSASFHHRVAWSRGVRSSRAARAISSPRRCRRPAPAVPAARRRHDQVGRNSPPTDARVKVDSLCQYDVDAVHVSTENTGDACLYCD